MRVRSSSNSTLNHPNLNNPCIKFDLNSLKNKNVMEILIFGGTSRLNIEMTSYSDTGYDVIYSFRCFEKFLVYTLLLPSFIVVR